MTRIKQFIQKSGLGKAAYALRDFYRYPKASATLRKLRADPRVAVLLGTPTFNNLGDHLIASAEKRFIQQVEQNRTVVEIPTQLFLRRREEIIAAIHPESPIYITGGGWMGSLWPDDEYRMQDMISAFCTSKIVVLPQTVYYDLAQPSSGNILQDAIAVYKKCRDIRFFFRDQASYDFAKVHFASAHAQVYLSPDIALFYPVQTRPTERSGFGLCLRKDREAQNGLPLARWITDFCAQNGVALHLTDTVGKYSIPVWLRERKIRTKLLEFGRYKLLITDRLHGMIFAALAGTKCIAMDNASHKVAGVYHLWLRHNPDIRLLEDARDEAEFCALLREAWAAPCADVDWQATLMPAFDRMGNQMQSEGNQ